MNVEERISAFSELGDYLSKNQFDTYFHEKIITAKSYNGWFTEENVLRAMKSLGASLSKDKLKKWMSNYELRAESRKLSESELRTIGVIMAGNIPCVGFHDFLCVLMSGHNIALKLSSNDRILMRAVAEKLIEIEPRFSDKIIFTEQMKDIDAVIATGSNNSSRYFEYYFSKIPRIIRKNRNSVAVIAGNETNEQLEKLGEDIFSYFGLGCRNVSKLFVPKNYSFNIFFESICKFGSVIDNKKYGNNYDYNRTIYLMNKTPLLDNNFVLLKEDIGLHSPVGVLFYEYYNDEKSLKNRLQPEAENIQCIISALASPLLTKFSDETICLPFGKSQYPEVWDYADGVDTMNFLLSI